MLLAPRKEDDDWLVIEAYSDSDYASDKVTRRSVTGMLILLNGAPISWRSKIQRAATLSSCEAEYYAMSETAQEVLYVKSVLEFLACKVKLPIVIKVDNQGAIFLANNESSTRTKHIDVRYHFVRDLVEAEVIKFEYVKTEENRADPNTKNVTTDLFKTHTGKLWDEQNG